MANCAATTLLIRHADIPENGGDDPSLSHAGVHRAEALAALLRDAAVGTIFATDTRRSQQTAGPLAATLGITPKIFVIDPSDIPAHINDVVAKLRDLPAATTALVIGHSNTLPGIIDGLDDLSIPEIQHDEFDHLFVLASGCLTHLRYHG
jgi:broad specificity phosphatase PhoE